MSVSSGYTSNDCSSYASSDCSSSRYSDIDDFSDGESRRTDEEFDGMAAVSWEEENAVSWDELLKQEPSQLNTTMRSVYDWLQKTSDCKMLSLLRGQSATACKADASCIVEDRIKQTLNSSRKCYNVARQSDVFVYVMLSLMVMFSDPQLHKYINNILLYYPLAEPSINWCRAGLPLDFGGIMKLVDAFYKHRQHITLNPQLLDKTTVFDGGRSCLQTFRKVGDFTGVVGLCTPRSTDTLYNWGPYFLYDSPAPCRLYLKPMTTPKQTISYIEGLAHGHPGLLPLWLGDEIVSEDTFTTRLSCITGCVPLYDFVHHYRNKGIWDTHKTGKLFYAMSKTLGFLHHKRILNSGCLRGETIYVKKSDDSSGYSLIFTDFTGVRLLGDPPLDYEALSSAVQGFPVAMMAPELINALIRKDDRDDYSDVVTPESEIFSLGSLLYTLSTGELLFPELGHVTIDDLKAASPLIGLAKNVREAIESIENEKLRAFFTACLQVDPSARADLHQLQKLAKDMWH